MRVAMNSDSRSTGVTRLILAIILGTALSGCHKERPSAKLPLPAPASARAPAPSAAMVAPTPLSPANDAAFHAHPRTVTLQWEPVKGATRYGVEIDCYGCCAGHQFCGEVGRTFRTDSTSDTKHSFDFVGDQPGRWRVWAISADGLAGPPSPWRRFTFGRVVGGNIIPPVIAPTNPAEVVACPATWRTDNFAGSYPPKAIYDPDPEYTDAARRGRVSGSTALGVTVGEDGLVEAVCVLRGLHADLDASAVGAVKTWRFQPAGTGAPVPAHLRVEVHFRLQ